MILAVELPLVVILLFFQSASTVDVDLDDLNKEHEIRGPRNIYILVMGAHGCAISLSESAIHEYTYGISSNGTGSPVVLGNITFIDVPGFIGTPARLNYDTQILATLQQFLGSHSELSRRKPDIVLLHTRYDDTHFSDEDYPFVKMLKIVSLIRDQWFTPVQICNEPNTAVLLTNPPAGVDSQPEYGSVTLLYQVVMQEYTVLPSPLKVLIARSARNRANNYRAGALGERPSWMRENVCKWMKARVFRNRRSFNMLDEMCNGAYNYTIGIKKFGLLSPLDSKVVALVPKLNKMELRVAETPVSLQLASVFNNLTEKGETFQAGTLSNLQMALNRLGLIDLDDIPVTNVEIAKLVRNLRVNATSLRLVHQALRIELPEIGYWGRILTPGTNVNLMTKIVARQSHSLFDTSLLQSSPLGFRIPVTISCSFGDPDHCLKLSITHRVEGQKCILRFQSMKCKMNSVVPRLQKNFTLELESLGRFIEQDVSNVLKWRAFLQKYGTHVINATYLGGVATIDSIPESWTSLATDELLNKLQSDEVTHVSNSSFSLTGGSPEFQAEQPVQFFSRHLLQNWLQSLQDYPALISQDIKPIEDYIRLETSGVTSDLSEVSEDFAKAMKYFRAIAQSDDLQPERSLVNNIVELIAKNEPLIKSEDKVKSELSVQTETLQACNDDKSASIKGITDTIGECEHDNNETLKLSSQVSSQLTIYETSLEQTTTQLQTLDLENKRLISEIQSSGQELATVKSAILAEQAESRNTNGLLIACDSESNQLQLRVGQVCRQIG